MSAGVCSVVVPVYGLRCGICGGLSTVIGKSEPEGMTWKCPHHGDDDTDGATFAESGVGEVGRDYEIVSFEAVPEDVAESLDAWEGLLRQLSGNATTAVRHDDFKAVVVDGKTSRERGEERGVSASTVRSNVHLARKDFDGGSDE